MNIHELKTDPKVFRESWDERKLFEIRKNDRNFKRGDRLLLRETVYNGEQMAAGKPLEYTGRAIEQTITYVMHGPLYGLKDGWVILSVTDFDHQQPGDFGDAMADQAM